MDVSPEAWTEFTRVASVVILLGTLAFALRRLGVLPPLRPSAAPTSVVPAPDADQTGRIARLEAQVQHIDNLRRDVEQLRQEVRDMHSRLNGIGAATDRNAGTLKEIGRSMALIQEHLLKKP